LKQEFQKRAEDYWVKAGEVAKFAKQLVRPKSISLFALIFMGKCPAVTL
jgi:hypothetical protein